MKYKINLSTDGFNLGNIQLPSGRELFRWLIVAGVPLAWVICRWYTGSWATPFKLWLETMKATIADQDFLLTLVLVAATLYALFVIGTQYYFFLFFRDVPLAKRDDITELDFQPTGVLLLKEEPVFLAYEQTSLQLTIHIDKKRHFDKTWTPRVTSLTLSFGHKTAIYTFIHFCDIEGIFPLLDYANRFASFSYKFTVPYSSTPYKGSGQERLFQDNPSDIQDVQRYAALLKNNAGSNRDLYEELSNASSNQPPSRPLSAGESTGNLVTDYRNFVEEQIQTHLRTGTHSHQSMPVPLSAEQADKYILNLIFVTTAAVLLTLFVSTLPRVGILIFLPPLLFAYGCCIYCAVKLIRHYKRKKQLKRFKK